MSDHRLWNPAAKPDIAERPDTAERSDMSGQTCPGRVSGTQLLSRIRLRGQTYLAWGADMSDQSL
jgi:hypothetical protein